MAKKNIVFRARLVKGERWHIDFTKIDMETGRESRHRRDFDLNEISDERIREEVGMRLVRYIEVFAPAEKPKAAPPAESPVRVSDALAAVLSLKMRLPRKNSRKGYKVITNKLRAWCEQTHYAGLPIGEFTRKHCRAFWQHVLLSRNYAPRTLNNYLERLRSIWNVMIDDELVTENPWNKIKPERVGEKQRRPFTDKERQAVAREIERTDYWLFRGVLLQFFCYVRPAELLRLRFRDFNLATGLVTINWIEAKSWKRRSATIPKSVLHYFNDGIFDKQPGNLFLFGRKKIKAGIWEMGPATEAISECRLNKRHRRVLERLHDAGIIGNFGGLSFYSWKDTGISMHARKTSPVATKDQAGHADLSITSLYYHPDPVNQEYRQLPNDLY